MRKLLTLFTALLFVGSMWGVDFTLVTSTSSLAGDDEIIIVNTDGDYAIGTTQNTNNRKAESVTVSENVITPSASVQTITLEASSTNWKFKVGTDQYLYAAGGNGKSPKNHLKTANSTTAGDNGVFSISIDANGVATIEGQGDATNSRMRYNPNNGTPMFSCYSSSSTVGSLVKIFKKATAPSLSIVPTSYDFGDVKDKAAASHDFTISGENLAEGTLNISVTGGYTITSGAITVDANGDLSSNTITVAKNTTTPGSNGGTLIVYGAGVVEGDAATATLSMTVKETFVVNAAVLVKDKENNPVAAEDVPEGISATINGSASYDVDADGELEIPIAATTISGYDFVGWTVSDINELAVSDAEALSTTLTATAAGVVTANFKEQSCTPLTAPANVVVSGINTANYPYSNVAISWNAVTSADKYDVTIKQGEDIVESATDLTTTSYSLTETLVANTTYSYEIVAKSNTPATHCDSDPASDNFVTGDYPAATLTLSENGVEHAFAGSHKLTDVVTLPSEVETGVVGKVLVGWSTVAVAETDTKPTVNYYDKGAEYTLSATSQKLYAVYATETPGTPSLTKMVTGNTLANGDKIVVVANGTQYGLYQEDNGSSYVKNWSFEGKDPVVGDLSDAKKIWDVTTGSTSGKWKLGDATNGYLNNTGSTSISVDDTGSEWTLSDLEDGTFNLTSIQKLSCRTDLSSGNANLWRGAGNGGTSGTPELILYKYFEGETSYSGYTTVGVRKLADPVFTPAGGTYTSAQNITISAAEGTIYYTLDGTDPTDESTEYTGAIALDTYGEHTIKAIAIDGDNISDVVSATYKIDVPFETVDALLAYVENNTPFDSVIVTGIVSEIVTEYSTEYKNITYNISDDGQTTEGRQLQSFRGKGADAASLKVGDKVTIKGVYTGSYALPELTQNNRILEYTAAAVTSVVISGDATQKEYDYNDDFLFDGLVATANYNTGYTKVVTDSANVWSANPATITASGDVTVTASFSGKNDTKVIAVTVNTYAVTFDAPEYGTLVVKNGETPITSGDEFVKGTVLTVVATPESGYQLATLTAGGEDILSTKSFTIGTADVEVVATFSQATAIDITEVEGKAVKVLRNGVLLIEKNGRTYNAMGQVVK